MIALLCCHALFGCAAKTPVPVVTSPTTVVQAPDPAVIHKIWEAGYAAGYGAAQQIQTRRHEQEQDELSNVPADITPPIAAAPAVPAPSPLAAAPNGFQSLGPATPVNAGD